MSWKVCNNCDAGCSAALFWQHRLFVMAWPLSLTRASLPQSTQLWVKTTKVCGDTQILHKVQFSEGDDFGFHHTEGHKILYFAIRRGGCENQRTSTVYANIGVRAVFTFSYSRGSQIDPTFFNGNTNSTYMELNGCAAAPGNTASDSGQHVWLRKILPRSGN